MLQFFKTGGVFLFDEADAASERTFYQLEELMGTEQGALITEASVDKEGQRCVFYDSGVLNEEQALEKYRSGQFVNHI